jgi:hypothetical protein
MSRNRRWKEHFQITMAMAGHACSGKQRQIDCGRRPLYRLPGFGLYPEFCSKRACSTGASYAAGKMCSDCAGICEQLDGSSETAISNFEPSTAHILPRTVASHQQHALGWKTRKAK